MTIWLQSLGMSEILVYGTVFGFPIVAIGFSSVVTVVNAVIKHRERMALIDQGLDPDDHAEPPCDDGRSDSWPVSLDETQPYVPPRRGVA